MKRLRDQSIGTEFKMLGTNINGKDKWYPAKLVSIDEGEYVVLSNGVRVICDGYEEVR